MMIELAMRNVQGGLEYVRIEQVQCICKYTGFGFLASVRVCVPAGRMLRRLRAVTLANGY